jgi:hypothetical protein
MVVDCDSAFGLHALDGIAGSGTNFPGINSANMCDSIKIKEQYEKE